MAGEASQISELWVQLRDPASMSRAEINGRRHPVSTLGFHTHVYKHAPICTQIHTHAHMPHGYPRSIRMPKGSSLGNCLLRNCLLLNSNAALLSEVCAWIMVVPGYGKAGCEHENEWLLLGWPLLLQVSIVCWFLAPMCSSKSSPAWQSFVGSQPFMLLAHLVSGQEKTTCFFTMSRNPRNSHHHETPFMENDGFKRESKSLRSQSC